MVLIGFIARRSTKNFDDYILGKESGAICDRASQGVGYERLAADGLPGRFPLRDFRKLDRHWLNAGAWINWKLVAGRLRVHTEVNNNALTLPDYFTGRFEDKAGC